MSIRIPKGVLNGELRKKIATDLWVQETYTQQGDPRSIRCFEVDDGYVCLPHFYSQTLFPEQSETDTQREELNGMNDLEFRGRL